jgi:hypothetical protein
MLRSGVLALLLGSCASARGDIIYSTFGTGGASNPPGVYDLTDSSQVHQQIAFRFRPTLLSALTEVEVALNQGLRATTANVYLSQDNHGLPGQVILSEQVAVPPAGGIAATFAGMPIVLRPRDTYWFSVDSAVPGSTLGWYWNPYGNLAYSAFNQGDGSGWFIQPSRVPVLDFRLSGTTHPAPEPGGLASLVVGLLVVGLPRARGLYQASAWSRS